MAEDDKEGVMAHKVMTDSSGELVAKNWRNLMSFLYILSTICVFRHCELNWSTSNYVTGPGITVEPSTQWGCSYRDHGSGIDGPH